MSISEKKVRKLCEKKQYENKEFVIETITFLANKLSKLSLKRLSEEEIVKKINENTSKISFSKVDLSKEDREINLLKEDKQELIEKLLINISYPGITSEYKNNILNDAFATYLSNLILYGSDIESYKIEEKNKKTFAIVNLLFKKLGSHRTLINYINNASLIKKDLQRIDYQDTNLWRYIDKEISKPEVNSNRKYFEVYNAISSSRVKDMQENDENISTGIRAIDESINPRIYNIINIFDNLIEYMEENTELTKKEIIKILNDNINVIDVAKPSEEFSSNGEEVKAKYIKDRGMILINNNLLEEGKFDEIQDSLRREVIFLMGLDSKVYSARREVEYVGYCRGESLGKIREVFKIKDNSFNKTATSMFLNENTEVSRKNFLRYSILTDQTRGDYDTYINTNLINQLIVALGIKSKKLYEGLYDIKSAQEVRNLANRFKNGTFKKISSNMDEITRLVKAYRKVENNKTKEQDKLDDKENIDKVDKEVNTKRRKENILNDLDKSIKSTEQIILKNLLLPSIKGKSEEEKQKLLERFYDSIILSKNEFVYETGFNEAKYNEKQQFKETHLQPNDIVGASKAEKYFEEDREL